MSFRGVNERCQWYRVGVMIRRNDRQRANDDEKTEMNRRKKEKRREWQRRPESTRHSTSWRYFISQYIIFVWLNQLFMCNQLSTCTDRREYNLSSVLCVDTQYYCPVVCRINFYPSQFDIRLSSININARVIRGEVKTICISWIWFY